MFKKLSYESIIGIVLFIFGLLGLYSSFVLSIEKYNILENPARHLSCSISSTLNCTSVMLSPQAEVLGFPNSLIGIMGYTAVVILGIFIYFHKNLNRNLTLLGLLAGLGAFLFSYWLLYQSVYKIQSLCIYCLMSCFAATNIFIAFKIYVLKQDTLNLNKSLTSKANAFISRGLHWPVIIIWYLVIFALVYSAFEGKFF